MLPAAELVEGFLRLKHSVSCTSTDFRFKLAQKLYTGSSAAKGLFCSNRSRKNYKGLFGSKVEEAVTSNRRSSSSEGKMHFLY
jgi:hypothetical protein